MHQIFNIHESWKDLASLLVIRSHNMDLHIRATCYILLKFVYSRCKQDCFKNSKYRIKATFTISNPQVGSFPPICCHTWSWTWFPTISKSSLQTLTWRQQWQSKLWKKTNWVSQSDQSMQLFVPSHREINKTLWQVKKDYPRYPNWSNALQHVRTM